MKIALKTDYDYSGIGISLYRHMGNRIEYVSAPDNGFETKIVELNTVTADATLIRVQKHELLDFYQSLKDQMIQMGILQKDLSEKEQVLIQNHLFDAIAQRDRSLAIAERMTENSKQLLTQNEKLVDRLLEPAITGDDKSALYNIHFPKED